MRDAHDRFGHDPRNQHKLHQRIAVADQHFEPRIAETAQRIGRPPRVVRAEPGEHQRAGVDEHVSGIGQQRQRAGNPAADRFGDEHQQRQREREQQPILAPRRRGAIAHVAVRVAVRVVMRMTVRVMVEVAHCLCALCRIDGDMLGSAWWVTQSRGELGFGIRDSGFGSIFRARHPLTKTHPNSHFF